MGRATNLLWPLLLARGCAPLQWRTAASASAVRYAAGGIGVGNILKYHVALRRREAQGAASWKSTQGLVRAKWVRHVFAAEGWLYAVQCLRNGITANTFLATTVLTLFTLSCGSLLRAGLESGPLGVKAVAQIGSLGALLLCSAYSFSQSARLMTHAGFMFPVAADCDGGNVCDLDDAALSRAIVENVVVRSHRLQWSGWRYLYLSSGVGAWVVGGEYAALAVSLALSAFFAREDRCPSL